MCIAVKLQTTLELYGKKKKKNDISMAVELTQIRVLK